MIWGFTLVANNSVVEQLPKCTYQYRHGHLEFTGKQDGLEAYSIKGYSSPSCLPVNSKCPCIQVAVAVDMQLVDIHVVLVDIHLLPLLLCNHHVKLCSRSILIVLITLCILLTLNYLPLGYIQCAYILTAVFSKANIYHSILHIFMQYTASRHIDNYTFLLYVIYNEICKKFT